MYIIIVAGASGSGKTTIVQLLKERFEQVDKTVATISIDQYYRSMEPGKPRNWDHVSALDLDKLVADIKMLASGEDTVLIPGYDYVTHQRVENKYTFGQTDILIVEGIFALYSEELRKLADLKVFVDADLTQECLTRRLRRDAIERGRSAESVINQYFEQVLPGYNQFVKPTRKYSDIFYLNSGEKPTANTKFIDIIVMCATQKL